MAKKKAAVPEQTVQDTASDTQKKLDSIGASKRAPVVKGERAKQLYSLLKEMKVKLVLDQTFSMGQYKDGKEPFGRFIVAREFRVVLDLTE